MPYVLPSEHRFAHEYSVFLHDLVVSIVTVGIQQGVFQFELELESESEAAAVEALDGFELYSWIEASKGSHAVERLDYSALVEALLADFCHFVLEGLRASAKGKLTVAYALFRKPLRDNLFYLEWLVADRADILGRFRTGGPGQLDISAIDPVRRLQIVETACTRCNPPGSDAKRIHDLRFDKATGRGLAAAWDQAIYLVTSPNMSLRTITT